MRNVNASLVAADLEAARAQDAALPLHGKRNYCVFKRSSAMKSLEATWSLMRREISRARGDGSRDSQCPWQPRPRQGAW